MDTCSYHVFSLKDKYFLLDVEASQVYSITYPAYCEITGSSPRSESSTRLPLWTRLAAKIEWRRLRKQIQRRFREEVQGKQREIQTSDRVLKGLWLGVSHACNLACTYCFANSPAYLGRNKLMSAEVALKGIDYLIETSGSNDELSIIFFGGEPLLNLPVIRKAVAYCQEIKSKTHKVFRFNMTTNGTLLTPDVFRELHGYGISIMISMDSTRALHDKHRKPKAGGSSWDMIVRNLEGIEDFGDYLAVRATLTDDDADLVESLECLQGLGFKSILFADLCPNSGLQRSADADGSSRRHREDGYLGLMEHILASASGIEEIPEMVLRDSVQDLQYGARRYFCCDTGRHHLYLDPDGDLYPCFRLMTPDGVQRVGSLESPPSPESLQVFYDTNVLTTVCFSCWARYLCGGPCFGNSFAAYGDFSTPDPVHCYHQKFSLYCAAYLLDHFNNAEKMSRADPGT